MSKATYDEDVVQALVLQHFGKCPDLEGGALRIKVTWAAMGDCAERREARRRIRDMEAPPAAKEGPQP